MKENNLRVYLLIMFENDFEIMKTLEKITFSIENLLRKLLKSRSSTVCIVCINNYESQYRES